MHSFSTSAYVTVNAFLLHYFGSFALMQSCYLPKLDSLASEAIRLHPKKTAYLGNRAAAALKLKGKRHLRQAAEDSVLGARLPY